MNETTQRADGEVLNCLAVEEADNLLCNEIRTELKQAKELLSRIKSAVANF